MKYKFNLIFLLKEALKKRWLFAVHQVIFALLIAIASPLFILITKILMEELLSEQSIDQIIIILLLYIISHLLASIYLCWQQHKYIPNMATLIKAHMNELVFNKIITIDYKYYDDPEFYNLYKQAIGEADTRALAVITTCRNLFGNLLGISALTSIMLLGNYYILIFAIISVVIDVILNWASNKYIFNYTQKRIPIYRKIGYIGRIFYLQQYGKEQKFFSLWKLFLNKYNEEINQLLQTYNESAPRLILYNFSRECSTMLMLIFAIIYLCINIIEGKIAITNFITILMAYQQFKNMANNIMGFIPKAKEHSMYIDKLREFLDYNSDIENSNGYEIKETFCNINLKNIFFKYNEKLVLNNITLSINKGEKIAITGYNGSGKSTLAKILLRIYDPLSGDIFFNTYKYNECNITSLRKHFSTIFQDSQCYSLSIAENILMRKIENENDYFLVWDLLELVGLSQKIASLEKGIDTILTKEFDNDGVVFSGGELQKLSIARSLAVSSDIIIMDEPTSNLDLISEYNLFQNIFKKYREKTIIIISHRLNFTNLADKIYYIENGEIKESGTFEELKYKNGKYYTMYKLQINELK